MGSMFHLLDDNVEISVLQVNMLSPQDLCSPHLLAIRQVMRVKSQYKSAMETLGLIRQTYNLKELWDLANMFWLDVGENEKEWILGVLDQRDNYISENLSVWVPQKY